MLLGNFSAGERQLLALARAMLYARKIIVMDEPTASIDTATDTRLQPLIRESFADHTLLTIAHRLNTVITMDRILVMAAGEVAEYGVPSELLEDADGALSTMVDAMGASAAEGLRARSKEAAEGGGAGGAGGASVAGSAREERLAKLSASQP